MNEFDRTLQKDPLSWTVADVGSWLQHLHLGEHRIKFIENFIAGSELLELAEEDLISLGVTAIGHRKKLTRAIKALNDKIINGSLGGSLDDDSDRRSDSGSEYSESSDTRSQDSNQNPTRVAIKCYYKKEVSLMSVKYNITLSKLKAKIRDQFGRKLRIQIKDNDGDLISIKNDKDLSAAMRHVKPPIQIKLSRRRKRSRSTSSNASDSDENTRDVIPEAEIAVLDTLLTGCIIIQDDGYIKYANPVAERIFGFTKDEMIGHNVKMLMPSNYGANHDEFIQRYLRTGKAKIIGTSRRVVARHKSGYNFGVDLAVTETKTATRRTFTGILTPTNDIKVDERSVPDENSTFSALQGLLEPAIVIDTKGTILFVNNATTEFFGYSENELVGENVNMLMPSPHKENHDFYLQNYNRTKVSTVIGKARPLICELKDGSIKPITLSVSESVVNGKTIFTGIVRVRETVPRRREKTLLQQEREVVNGLFVAGIIIDRDGLVQAFNKGAQKIFGFDLSEILGRNISIITGPHKDKHDGYIKRYLETGEARIIGQEREVVSANKAGKEIKIKLSVVEKKDEEGRQFFTGMLHQVS